jgi:hypothetical protein
MKKQLLIAAVAATMATASMADVSISGAATANINTVSGSDTTFASDIDLKIVGKSGVTSATVDLEFLTTAEPAASNFVKNAYITTNVGGANIKIGDWYGADSLLGNGTNDDTEQLSVDYTMNGLKVQYEAQGASDSVTLSGTVAGVAVSHEMFDTKTDSKVSASMAGVAMTYRSIDDDDSTKDATSLEVSTAVSGIKLGYAKIDRETAGTSDAFFGLLTSVTDATGVSVGTAVAGNNVTFKALDIDGTDTNKVIINRPMAGGTFEFTYADKDGAASSTDLELKVAF